MRIQIITTITRTVSQESTDPIRDIKAAEGPLEVIKIIMDNTTIHMEVTTKITIMVTTEVEVATAMDIVIIVDVAMVKTIIKVTIITSTISIIVMMIITRFNSMDNHVLYVVFTITHQNMALRVNVTPNSIMEKMSLATPGQKQSGLYQ